MSPQLRGFCARRGHMAGETCRTEGASRSGWGREKAGGSKEPGVHGHRWLQGGRLQCSNERPVTTELRGLPEEPLQSGITMGRRACARSPDSPRACDAGRPPG